MRQVVRILLRSAAAPTLALLMAATASHAADEKVLLTYKSAANQVARYRSEGTLHLEVAGMKVNLDMKEVEKVTYQAPAANGDVKMERETESSETAFNGQKAPPPSEPNKEKTTVVIRKDGALISYKITGSEHDDKTQVRLFAATSPVFTDKPVGVGDKWSRDYKADSDLGLRAAHADYEVLGFEKSAGADSVKIKMSYKETEGSPALSCTSTLFVEKSSGDTVSGDFEIDGLQLDLGGAMASANGKVHGERLSGSPVGGGKIADPKAEAAAAKKEKTIEEIVKGYDKLPGLFTLYRKKEPIRDTIYLEINESQLNQLLMLEATFSTGNGRTIAAGEPINDIPFKFVRMGDDKLMIVTPNYSFKAKEGTPLDRAVKRSFPDAYLESFRIEAKDAKKKSLLINVSEFFRGDFALVTLAVNGGGGIGGIGGGYALDREKTSIETIKNFPENLVVETAYHFFRGTPIGGLPTLADPRSMPLKVNYTLFQLKEDGYRPRLADSRVGYFLTNFESFDDDNKQDTTTHYILRWNLEKSDPKAKLSPPKKPIVMWLDNAIPLEYRDAVRDGILYWNKAFERIGYKDALVVKQMPDNADWDHADMRYNVVRWVTSPWQGGAGAVAYFRPNPMTGEIINANVNIDANWTRYTKIEKGALVDPAAYFAESPFAAAGAQAAAASAQGVDEVTAASYAARKMWDPRYCEVGKEGMEQAWFGEMALTLAGGANPKLDRKAYINAFLKELVAHEMGHNLGLRHNFIGSCYHSLAELKNPRLIEQTGITASVMDYTPFNISALKTAGVDYFSPTVGPYDIWAVEYGYTPIDARTPDGEVWKLKQIASRCNEPGLAYQSDEIADQFDPSVTRYDLSSNPLQYWQKSLDVTRYLLFQLGKRLPAQGDSYWEFTRNFNRMLNMYARSAAITTRYIGGLHVARNFRGDSREKPVLQPVPAAEQKRALRMVNDYVFAENAFSLPRDYYGKMTGDPFPNLQSIIFGASDFPIMDSLASVQRAALSRLFGSATLRRVANNEFKIGDESKAFTMPYLFHTVSAAVWSELDSRKPISALRRQLQRNFLDQMINMTISPGGAPDDARMLAWDQLRQLKGRLSAAKTTAKDEYTRLHLEESLMRVNRALDARQTLGGGGGGAGSLLQLLLGGGKAPVTLTRPAPAQ